MDEYPYIGGVLKGQDILIKYGEGGLNDKTG